MHSPKRIKVTEVNPHLICVLCRGYYIDATTIIECLHSFCKTCIVKYLQTNKYCPICDVQVHKTTPLLSIRSDRTLQNIVYKLVPSLFKSEMERRVAFYRQHPEHLPAFPEDRGEVCDTTPIFLPDEILVVCLEYLCDKPTSEPVPKRFLHCPAEMTLAHITKLIRGKFSLLPSHQVNVLFKDDLLPEYLTIMEVAYTYQCRRRIPIHLFYRILELKKTTIRLLEVKEKKDEPAPVDPQAETAKKEKCGEEAIKKAEKRQATTPLETCPMEKGLVMEKASLQETNCQQGDNKSDNEWKEVQLQISENGVMSFRDMKNSECSPKTAVEAPQSGQGVSSPTVAQLSASMTPVTVTVSTQPVVTATSLPVTRPTTSNGPLVSLPSELTTSIVPANYPGPPRIPSSKPILSVSKVTKDQVKKDFNNVEANKLSISRVPAAGFKEKGEALNKIVSKLSPNERVIGNTSVTIRPVLSTPPVKTYQPPAPQPHHQPQPPPPPPPKVQKSERKPQQTVRYKTLTSPTKQWNPSIDRTTMLTMKQNYDMSKPPRFFKMRNMPRYLGNPASGVKPMFGTMGGEEVPKEKPRSPTKLPPPFTPGSPKGGKSPYPDKTSWTPRVPSPAHSGSLYNSNPYLLYSGFPGSFNPDPSLLANANPDLVRSMFANPAYHPSLPPSINMLFNPHHGVPRPSLESPPSVQRIPRTKSPSKSEEKVEKPIPNLIPANLPASHVVPRSPTLPPSNLGVPSSLGVPPGPSIPPHPSHPPGSLLPPGSSPLPLRLPPPLSIASPIHHHNSLLHQAPSLLSSPHHPLGSPRAPSPAGSPRTGSPLHISPPKPPQPSPGGAFSPTKSKPEMQKSPSKSEKSQDQPKRDTSTPTSQSAVPNSAVPSPPKSSTTTPASATTTTVAGRSSPAVTAIVNTTCTPSPTPTPITSISPTSALPSTPTSSSTTEAPKATEPSESRVSVENDKKKSPQSESVSNNNNLSNEKGEVSNVKGDSVTTEVSEGN